MPVLLNRRALIAGAGLTIIARPAELLAATKAAFSVTELLADLSSLSGTFGRGINRKATIVGIATGRNGPGRGPLPRQDRLESPAL